MDASLNRVGEMQRNKWKSAGNKIYFLNFIMTQQNFSQPFSIPPGEILPDDMKKALKNANAQYVKSRDFKKYTKTLQILFGLPDFVPFTEEHTIFLGGFIEGEGSISVSAKKSKTSQFGVYFDPEFSLTQHVNGSKHLFECLCHFRTGFIRHKNKSNATLVYTIDSRETLKQKIVPFFKKYVSPYSCFVKEQRFQKWCTLLDFFDEGAHKDFKRFVYEIGPIWDQMRMQKGQSNESFVSFEDFEHYVIAHVKEKRERGKSS
jgi:hypothetical protein